jgi:hypothetical protein
MKDGLPAKVASPITIMAVKEGLQRFILFSPARKKDRKSPDRLLKLIENGRQSHDSVTTNKSGLARYTILNLLYTPWFGMLSGLLPIK